MFTCSHIISVRIIKHLRLFNRCDLFVNRKKRKLELISNYWKLLVVVMDKTKKDCSSRESNPGLIRGRDLSYHLTTTALISIFLHCYLKDIQSCLIAFAGETPPSS